MYWGPISFFNFIAIIVMCDLYPDGHRGGQIKPPLRGLKLNNLKECYDNVIYFIPLPPSEPEKCARL